MTKNWLFLLLCLAPTLTQAQVEEKFNPLKTSVSSQDIYEAIRDDHMEQAETLLKKEDALLLVDFRERRNLFLTRSHEKLMQFLKTYKLEAIPSEELCSVNLANKLGPTLQVYAKAFELGRRAGGMAEYDAFLKFKAKNEDKPESIALFFANRKWIIPSLIHILEDYAYALSFTDQKVEAVRLLTEVVEIAPERLSAQLRLAGLKSKCYKGMDDFLEDLGSVRKIYEKACELSPAQDVAEKINSYYPDLCTGNWTHSKMAAFAKEYKHKKCNDGTCVQSRCYELPPKLFWYCSLQQDYEQGIANYIQDLPACIDALRTFKKFARPSEGSMLILGATVASCKASKSIPDAFKKRTALDEQRCLDRMPLDEKRGKLGQFKAATCQLAAFHNYYNSHPQP